MKKTKINNLFLSVFFAIATVNICFAQSPTKPEKIDNLLTMLHKQGQFNGNILVADKGEIVLSKSYGLKDEIAQENLDENTIFDLASVSKQFTAMGIVLLQEKGQLSFDDEVGNYIPELGMYNGITIRQLLTHTSGLPDYMRLLGENWDKTRIATNKDLIKAFGAHKPPAIFLPGARFKYSNSGYVVLASVIENVSGMSYAKFLKENIFEPLEMKNTLVHNRRLNTKKIPNLALGYTSSDSDMRIVIDDSENGDRYYYLDGIVGDGAVNSTVLDLLKWDRALYSNSLVSSNSLEEIYTPSKTSDGKTNQYGFGWRIQDIAPYGNVRSHSGKWAGFVTFFERHIDSDKTIILLQNFDQASNPITNIREILYDQTVTPIFKKEIKIGPELLIEYTGDYVAKSDPNSIISITSGGNHIVYNSSEQKWNMKFYPESNTSFFSKIAKFNIQIRFVKETNEQYKIELYQNGKIIEEGARRK